MGLYTRALLVSSALLVLPSAKTVLTSQEQAIQSQVRMVAVDVRVSDRDARIQLASLAALGSIGLATASLALPQDPARPPPILNSGGRFSAVRVARPPLVDGREWIAARVHPAASPGTVPVPGRAFSLTLTDCGDRGDFTRCQVLFQRGRAAPVRIDNGFTGWVFVTPDGRYIVTEPLYVLDVTEWKQYALFEAFGIPNYTSIEAISRDGKRLFLSRRDCVIDCSGVGIEYFEVRLPQATRVQGDPTVRVTRTE